MQQVTENRPLIGSERQPDQPKVSTSPKATRVWAALTEIYGEAFTRKHGDAPSPIWIHKLNSLSERELRHGLNQQTESGRTFPPGLPEFIKACRSAPVEDQTGLAEAWKGRLRSVNIDPTGIESEDDADRLFFAKKLGHLMPVHLEQLPERLRPWLNKTIRPEF